MIYLNDKITNFKSSLLQQVNTQPKIQTLQNNPTEIDSVSISNKSATDKPESKKNKLIAYIIGALALIAGGIFTIIKLKRMKTAKTGQQLNEQLSNAQTGVEKASKKLDEIATRNAEMNAENVKRDIIIAEKETGNSKLAEKIDSLSAEIKDKDKQIKEGKNKIEELTNQFTELKE